MEKYFKTGKTTAFILLDGQVDKQYFEERVWGQILKYIGGGQS